VGRGQRDVLKKRLTLHLKSVVRRCVMVVDSKNFDALWMNYSMTKDRQYSMAKTKWVNPCSNSRFAQSHFTTTSSYQTFHVKPLVSATEHKAMMRHR
jgi:hypothetical protein